MSLSLLNVLVKSAYHQLEVPRVDIEVEKLLLQAGQNIANHIRMNVSFGTVCGNH